MFDLYILNDWNGNPHIMSSSKIHKRIISDSNKSNYNWIASASELINVCNKKDFPKEKAYDIEVAILNCYSKLMTRDKEYLRMDVRDIISVYSAYNSLYGVDDCKVIEARERFLRSFISLTTHYSFLSISHHGKNFEDAKKEWIDNMFNELFKIEQIDFFNLFPQLKLEFTHKIQELEKSGLFDEEDKMEKERLLDYARSLLEQPKNEKILAKRKENEIRIN